MESSENDIYINEAKIPGEKPEISSEQKKELLKKGEDSTCRISIPDVKIGNGFFCQIFYNENNYNVLILKNKIIDKKQLKVLKELKIKYEDKNILIKNKLLDLNFENQKYNFIEINDYEINNFYKIENFNGEFTKEMINEIKKKKEINLYVKLFPILKEVDFFVKFLFIIIILMFFLQIIM